MGEIDVNAITGSKSHGFVQICRFIRVFFDGKFFEGNRGVLSVARGHFADVMSEKLFSVVLSVVYCVQAKMAVQFDEPAFS